MLAFFISGCNDYKQLHGSHYPDITLSTPVPHKWHNKTNSDNVNIIQKGWVAEFNDANVSFVARQVLKKNQDIIIAANKLKSAEAAAEIAGASLKPSANVNLNNSNSGNFDNSDSSGKVGASVDISWELDLWGKIEADSDAALLDYQASKADFEAAQESLIAQAVKAYFLAIDSHQQYNVATSNRESYLQDLKITEVFYEMGEKTIQDVAIAKANLASASEAVIKARNAFDQSIRSLELLIGVYPGGQYEVPTTLPQSPGQIPAGIPADILENRPDIRAKERQIASAFNASKSAKAAKLPSIALTSNLGSTSNDLKTLNNPTNMFWNFAGNILVPLFNDGVLQNNVVIADSDQKIAIAEYQKAALNAFNDVESSLDYQQSLNARMTQLELNLDQSELALEVEDQKYKLGEGNILDISQLKRNVIASKSDLIAIEREILTEKVNLYLALGIPAFN